MVVGFAVLWLYHNKSSKNASDFKITYTFPGIAVLVSVCFLMLTVVIRSYLGSEMNFPWKSIPFLSFVSVLSVVSGKAFGGILADKYGIAPVVIISLTVAAILFVFSFESPIAGSAAILLFNITMPLTLTLIARQSKRKYGFSFGLTTFALSMGFVLTVFQKGHIDDSSVFVLGCVVSLVLIISGFVLFKKKIDSK